MKNKNTSDGFIPMLIVMGIIILAVIWFVYERVTQANH